MDIHGFVESMAGLAPPELAEEFDEGRIGLVVEGKPEIERTGCALDVTPRVIDEAVRLELDMLVVHHTPIFHPVTCVRGSLAPILRSVLSAGLNIFVMHTNFDHAVSGVNDSLASLLGLSNQSRMTLGVVGDCSVDLPEISRILDTPLRVWGDSGPIRRLAVVGGSGFDEALLREALDLGADAFLSSEAKHSVIRGSPLRLIEATHYALEAPAMRMLSERMNWYFIDDPPRMISCP